MNIVIETLMKHQSIRKFKDTPLTEEQIHAIIDAAQMASTSSNLQAYSIIGVTDPELKNRLAELAGGQAYVAACPLFLVFCADLHRMQKALEKHGKALHHVTENFLVATVDAALAAQNAAVAAESLGLGIVYIGGIRQAPREVSDSLKLPKLVYPVFGMCVGVPDQDPGVKPRLPRHAVFHVNGYQAESVREGIDAYDAIFHDYFYERTGGKVDTTWSARMAERYSQPSRPHMKKFLEEQGFCLE
jgi:FMN reductase (NADPH)